MPKKKTKTKVKIDLNNTVIVKVHGGAVVDYHVPLGLEMVVVDYDAIDVGEETDELTQAAMEFLDSKYE